MCGRWELDQTEVWDVRRNETVNSVVSTILHSSSRIGYLRRGEIPGGVCKLGSADRVGNAGGTRKDRSQKRRNGFASSGGRQGSELHPTSS